MEPNVNPCVICHFYREQCEAYASRIKAGDYRALEGLKTVLEVAMTERDSEIEELLKQNPGLCDNEGLCIYSAEKMQEVYDKINEVIADIRQVNARKRSLVLVLRGPFR